MKFYTWEEMHYDCIKISNLVKEVGFIPDGIIGVGSGGCIPANIISRIFNVPFTLVDLSVDTSRVSCNREIDQISISASHGKRYVLISDFIDSGETIRKIKDRCFDSKLNFLYTALWFNPDQMNCTINFYSNLFDRSVDSSLLKFPWNPL